MKKILKLMTVFMPAAILISCSDKKEEREKPVTETAVDSPMVYVRKNANSPAALPDLEAMAIALAKMREMACTMPASWYYQGAMHWIPDTIPNNNPFCPSYVSSKTDPLKLAWDNCTHESGINSSFNFLIWHRFYTMHFEEVVRSLSGKKDFAMPYWDYTDTVNMAFNRKMPVPVRTLGNPLFEASRLDSLNQGYDISGFMNANLNTAELMQNSIYLVFCNQINSAPHGAMHNYIGGGYTNLNYWNPIYQDSMNGGGMMANVPSAGFDPIFWLHHSNIDRLWQKWTNLNPAAHRLDAQDVISHPWSYVFFDAKGDTIQYTMPQVAEQMYNVNYTYDDVPTAAPVTLAKSNMPTQATLLAQAGDTLFKIKVNKPINPKLKTLTQTIKLDEAKKGNLKTMATTAPKTLILNVTVSFTKEPKNDYQVYINLPKGTQPNARSQSFVGVINFFGAIHHAMHAEGNAKAKGPFHSTFSFEVSDEFKDLDIGGKNGLDISIIQQGELIGGAVTLDSYTIYSK